MNPLEKAKQRTKDKIERLEKELNNPNDIDIDISKHVDRIVYNKKFLRDLNLLEYRKG